MSQTLKMTHVTSQMTVEKTSFRLYLEDESWFKSNDS